MEDNEKSLPVKLNPVQKVGLKSYQKPDEGKQTEFDRIKLKKATKGVNVIVCTIPEYFNIKSTDLHYVCVHDY